MPTLYELADARHVLDLRLYESEGEVTPELERELDALNLSIDEKIEKVALYIREIDVEAELIKAEEERLQKRRHGKLKTKENLKDYLRRHMTAMGHERVRGKLITVWVQENPPSVTGELAPELLRYLAETQSPLVKIVPEQIVLDRRAALDCARAGNTLPDGLTVVRESSVRIR